MSAKFNVGAAREFSVAGGSYVRRNIRRMKERQTIGLRRNMSVKRSPFRYNHRSCVAMACWKAIKSPLRTAAIIGTKTDASTDASGRERRAWVGKRPSIILDGIR